MYKVDLKLLERQLTFDGKRSKRVSNLQPPQYYTTASGVQRVKIMHPTKGWRDRNADNLSLGMTGLRANEFKLVAKDD